MKSWEIVGWTGDAEILCAPCGYGRWGVASGDESRVIDSEGNEVQPVFADQADDETCGSCGESLI